MSPGESSTGGMRGARFFGYALDKPLYEPPTQPALGVVAQRTDAITPGVTSSQTAACLNAASDRWVSSGIRSALYLMGTRQRTNANELHEPIFPQLPGQCIKVTLSIILWALGTFTGTHIFFCIGAWGEILGKCESVDADGTKPIKTRLRSCCIQA